MSRQEIEQKKANIKNDAEKLRRIFGSGVTVTTEINEPFDWAGSNEVIGDELRLNNKYDIRTFVDVAKRAENMEILPLGGAVQIGFAYKGLEDDDD